MGEYALEVDLPQQCAMECQAQCVEPGQGDCQLDEGRTLTCNSLSKQNCPKALISLGPMSMPITRSRCAAADSNCCSQGPMNRVVVQVVKEAVAPLLVISKGLHWYEASAGLVPGTSIVSMLCRQLLALQPWAVKGKAACLLHSAQCRG